MSVGTGHRPTMMRQCFIRRTGVEGSDRIPFSLSSGGAGGENSNG